ncbi:MAG: DEAD/DEAH box helicase [Spirochaetaceae bacterium]
MTTHSFAGLGLSDTLRTAVTSQGYEAPTDIQARAIPLLLAGGNLLGTAQTGTGKTAAFVLPILQRLAATYPVAADGRTGARTSARRAGGRPAAACPRALVLAPTRELAVQIDESVAAYGAGSGLGHLAVFGGAPKGRQLTGLARRPSILTATPGRLLDFVGERAIDLSHVEILVIDEADRMLDMGFIPDVRRIASLAGGRSQTMLFSATMPEQIEGLARELLGEFARVAVAPEEITIDRIRQSVLHLAQQDKSALLPELIRHRDMSRVLVFTRTKHRAARLAKALRKTGIASDEIHGNRSQNQRQNALERFRNGRVQVLVGTDVAARGIDVDEISHVINYEIPHEPETYVHRIGRTARAGADGEAISMCDTAELEDFRRIEKLLDHRVTVDREHAYHAEPAPPRAPRGGSARAGHPGGRRPQPRRNSSYRGRR